MNNCFVEHSFVFPFVHFYTKNPQFIPRKKRSYPHRFLPVFPLLYKGFPKGYPPIHAPYYEYYYIYFIYNHIRRKHPQKRFFLNKKYIVWFLLLKILYGVSRTARFFRTVGN